MLLKLKRKYRKAPKFVFEQFSDMVNVYRNTRKLYTILDDRGFESR
jgi:hypothetical protein